MGLLVVLFLLLSFGTGTALQGEVDYFKREEKAKQKEEEKSKKEYYEKLYREAQDWFPETTNPLEKAFYKNPDDPVIVELLNRFYTERQERANLLASKLILLQSQQEEKLAEVLKNYTVLYFYSPQCPYCRASEPYLSFLESNAKKFLKINILMPENSVYLKDFGIRATPTLVFVRDGREVRRWEGMWVYPSQATSAFLRSLP
ncbi:MAG: thioredoxin family protein [Nitrososphaerales archaeon]